MTLPSRLDTAPGLHPSPTAGRDLAIITLGLGILGADVLPFGLGVFLSFCGWLLAIKATTR